MFRQRRELRRWARRVLLLWVFGVGFGVANACLASQHFERVAGAIPALMDLSSSADEAMPEGCDHHTPGAAADRDQGDPQTRSGKSNCERFCERAGVPTPPQKSTLDDLHGHVLLPVVLASITPVPAAAPPRFSAPSRQRVRAFPIPIVFLRLAL